MKTLLELFLEAEVETIPSCIDKWKLHFKTKFKFKNVIVYDHFIERSIQRNLSLDELNYIMKKLDRRMEFILNLKPDNKKLTVDEQNEWQFKWQFRNYKAPSDRKYFRDMIGAVSTDFSTLKFISLLTPNRDTIARDKQDTTNKIVIEKLNEEVIDDRLG